MQSINQCNQSQVAVTKSVGVDKILIQEKKIIDISRGMTPHSSRQTDNR